DDPGRRVPRRPAQPGRLAAAPLGLARLGLVQLPVQLHGTAGRVVSRRVHPGWPAGRLADRRPPLRRPHRAAGVGGLRSRAPVGRAPARARLIDSEGGFAPLLTVMRSTPTLRRTWRTETGSPMPSPTSS